MDILKFLESQAQKKAVGTLTLGKTNSFREVFCQGEAVYIVGEHFSGKVAVRKLSDLGIPGERISPQNFEAALHEADRTRRIFAEYLLEHGLLSEDELVDAATEQLLEELTETLFRTQQSFHFQEDLVPDYLLTSNDIAARSPVAITQLIEALRRRADLWKRFEVLVPSREEIFVLTERGMALRQGGGEDRLLVQALGLIDGMRDLQSILRDTYFYESHVEDALLRALEDGLIKKTIHPELRGISTHTLKRSDAERCLPWFKNAVKYGVDELAARERLAVVYEKLERVDEAVIQYNYIGDSLYRMRKAAKAMKAYQKALQLKPDEILVTEKITRIYSQAASEEILNGNTAQAIQFLLGALRIRPTDRDIFTQALPLLVKERRLEELSEVCDLISAQARKTRSAEVALEACKDILKELPGNAAFRKKLINIYLDFGRTTEASAELQTLARQYLERGQTAKAQELIEKVRRLGVSGAEVRQIERLFSAAQGGARQFKLRRVLLLCALALASYQAWTYRSWSRIEQASRTADAMEGPLSTIHSPGARTSEERYVRIARQCEEFSASHPLSIWRPLADRLQARLESSARRLAEERSQQKLAVLNEARKAAAEGKREETLRILQPVLGLTHGEEVMVEAQEILRRLGSDDPSAEDLLTEGRRLESSGEPEAAYKTYHRLVEMYPQSVHVPQLLLPVVVESVPAGAEVSQILAPGEVKVLGKTPHAIHLPHSGAMELQIILPGHDSRTVELQGADGPLKRYFLDRKREWSVPNSNRTEPWPILVADTVLVGMESGGLAAIRASTGKLDWRFSPESHGTLVARPEWTEEGILTLWNTGHLLFLPPPRTLKGFDGAQTTAQEAATEVFLGSLAASPLHAPVRSPFVLVGTHAGNLQAYSRRARALAWSLNFESPPKKVTDLEEDLLLMLHNGGVARVRVNPPSIVWKRQIGSAGAHDILHTGKAVLVLAEDGDLIFLKSENGETAYVRHLPTGSKAVISHEDRTLFTLSPDGKLAVCASETAEEVSTEAVEKGAASLQTIVGGVVVTTADLRRFFVYRSDPLAPVWSARTSKPITAIVGSSDWILVSTGDGELSAYRRK